MKCPTCQFQNREDAQFCHKCGYLLAEPKAAPPIDYSQPQSYTPRFLADKESILVRCQLFGLSGENDSRSDLKNFS